MKRTRRGKVMEEKDKKPEKIDVNEVLGSDAGADDVSEVELLDPATGKSLSARSRESEAALAELRAERDRAHDLWVRARADFENLRKRVEREREEERSQAGAAIVRDLLPVLDNLDRALENAPEANPFRDGVALIQRQLRDALARAGLEPIEAVGESFDPIYHEAVVTERTNRFEPNRVLEEIRKGYQFRGRVLRPALVKVAVRPAETAGQGGQDDGGDAGGNEEPGT
jgi:molecular chaperone GrpE